MRTLPACGQFDQHGDIRAVAVQRRMHRMMRALVAVDAPLPCHLLPGQVERMAAVADPLRPPLPGAAAAAFLNPQLALAAWLPNTARSAHRRVVGSRQAFGQIGVAHSTASEPRMRELTGVTIGPPMMIAASLRFTWLIAVPRICRTASITSSSPCM